MLKKKICLEGMDRDYKLTVALCTSEEIQALAGKPPSGGSGTRDAR
jgi:hypothetical protein